MTNVKDLVQWSEEGSPSRARNLILFSTILLYYFVTIILLGVSFIVAVPNVAVNIYYGISAIFVSVIGFYTTTHPKTAEVLSQDNQLQESKNQLDYFRGVFDKILSNSFASSTSSKNDKNNT